MPVLEKHRNISASGNLAEAAAVKELDFIFFMDSWNIYFYLCNDIIAWLVIGFKKCKFLKIKIYKSVWLIDLYVK
jgi:hypothetical protein